MAQKSKHAADFRSHATDSPSPAAADLRQLTRMLAKYAPHDGGFHFDTEGVSIYRSSKIESERTCMLSRPSICLVPQGEKSASYAGHGFAYDKSKLVVYAAEIPLKVKITKASPKQPYLGMVIHIDPQRLSEMALKAFPYGLPKTEKTRAVYVGDSHPKILKSAIRLMQVIEEQENTDLLAPLVIDEILVRLLRSPAGPSIAQIGVTGSHADKIAKAISWLKDNYVNPIKMEDLAKIAGMSVSSFHTHFKQITSISPLKYQKTLRLQEARRLVRMQMMDVSSVAYEVGYASPTQFSREYTREFGISPSKDAKMLGV